MLACLLTTNGLAQSNADLSPVQYNHPGLAVDLGVGLWAWPLPMDWDRDGDLDLLVSCPDKPYSGTYFFENPSGSKTPIFKPGIRVGKGFKNIQVSYVEQQPRVLNGNQEYFDFLGKGFDDSRKRSIHSSSRIFQGKGNQRFNVWSYVDYNADGLSDLLVGVDDWGDYGWDDGFDAEGNWKRGPLHGLVFVLIGSRTGDTMTYAEPKPLMAGGQPVNVYGNPMPNMADFDNDGDLDLICGEFLDGFTYFENVGSRTAPVFRSGRRLKADGIPVRMHVQMITPSAIDWDGDQDIDLICGDEDGRVALIENRGNLVDGTPEFSQPVYFQQQARDLKFGALITPFSFDWDGDQDEDLVCGNTSGNLAWFENLDGGDPPCWSAPRTILAEGREIHLQAGAQGSIQGPAEAKWGYTTLSVADWDHDDLPDLIVNSIWGKVEWFKNVGTRQAPKFSAARTVDVQWQGEAPKPAWTWWQPRAEELATQWRTTPIVVDWNEDGWNDLLMLDHEGYLAFFRRERVGQKLVLHPGERIFRGDHFDSRHAVQKATDDKLRLNAKSAGSSGRRKLCVVDWDADGHRDLLVNSVNASWLRNVSEADEPTTFINKGPLGKRVLAGHTTSPTTADWDGDGFRDLLLGAEDGRVYYLKNPHSRH